MVYNGTRLRFVKLYRNGKLQLAHSLNGRNEFRARGAGGINDAVVIRIVGLGQALGTEPQSVAAVDIPAFTLSVYGGDIFAHGSVDILKHEVFLAAEIALYDSGSDIYRDIELHGIV